MVVASSVAYDGVTPDALAARCGVPALRCLAEVDSTLDVLHAWAAEGAPAGATVVADRQARGRGRQGRTWESPAGRGVWLAYLLRPLVPPETGVLALRVGLAVARALERLGAAPRLKWPNDVLLGGRKVAGVLCEARWREGAAAWVAVGIGLNVHGPLPPAVAGSAAALDEAVSVGRVTVLERLCRELVTLPETPTLTDDERDALVARDTLTGRRLREPVAGQVIGIDAGGALVVRGAAGLARVTGGPLTLDV